jgi:hypothetical protein
MWSLVPDPILYLLSRALEDEHTSRYNVELDSPSNGPRHNTTAGSADQAGENAQYNDSRSHDDHKPDGSKYGDDDDESEEGDGEDEEPALKYERMGGTAQEFFGTGKDSASALCIIKGTFVSGIVLRLLRFPHQSPALAL